MQTSRVLRVRLETFLLPSALVAAMILLMILGSTPGIAGLAARPATPPYPNLPLTTYIWTNVTPTNSPPPRAYAAMAYDPSLSGIILFGGSDPMPNGSAVLYNDTWLFAHGNWTKVNTTNAPPAEGLSNMVYDAKDGYLLLFGGSSSRGLNNETWEFQKGKWVNVTTRYSPPIVSAPEMAYDPSLGEVVEYSGWGTAASCGYCSTNGPVPYTWVYSAGVWTNVTKTSQPKGGPSGGRTYGSLAYDPQLRALVLVGGSNGRANPTGTWTYNGTWSKFPSNRTLPATNGQVLAYDPVLTKLVLFGGAGSKCNATVCPAPIIWGLGHAGWHKFYTTGSPMTWIFGSMVYYPPGKELIYFGGSQYFHDSQSTWSLT